MKEFIEAIRSIYNRMCSFQVEMEEKNTSEWMGHILTKDDLKLYAIHLTLRWVEVEKALNKLENVKVRPEYADIPFHWEVMDELVDYMQNNYPSIYNEACDNVQVFRDGDGEVISLKKYKKIKPEYFRHIKGEKEDARSRK